MKENRFSIITEFAGFLNSCTAVVGVGRMKSDGKVARKGSACLNVLKQNNSEF